MEANKNAEDSQVCNLIKELNHFIKSCDHEENFNKKENDKQSKHVERKENVGVSQQNHIISQRNKRKTETPIKRRREIDEYEMKTGKNCSSFVKDENKSFSMNETNEDNFDSTSLTIDESRTKRRRPNLMNMADIPKEVMELMIKSGIDDKLENVAMKEKLTGIHVRNIIKQVVMDKSVLAMLKNGIGGTDSEETNFLSDYEPKLTRARKRELLERKIKEGVENPSPEKSSVLGLGSYTVAPSSCSSPSSTTLVTTEFPEDDDDDEYQPALDDMISDEESVASSFGSPSTLSIQSFSSRTPSSTDFLGLSPLTPLRKDLNLSQSLAQKCLKFNMDESLIYSRTRSKCPLTDTPLEHLEMAFQPPDITADMYETDVIDEDWKKFLFDLSRPQDAIKAPEDDEQIDPEYNLIGDAEEETPSPDELKEELRGDKAVKISKKEVDGLFEELMDSSVSEDDDCEDSILRSEGDKSLLADKTWTSNVSHIDTTIALTQEWNRETEIMDLSNNEVLFEKSSPPPKLTKKQLLILKCQLTKHVQLLTQSILMTCYEEKFNYIELGCKEMLNDFENKGSKNFANSENFRAMNWKSSYDTIQHFDSKRKEFLVQREKKVNRKLENCGSRNYERNYVLTFPPIIQTIFATSSSFPFTELLPRGIFSPCNSITRKGFTTSEYYLLAMSFKELVSDINVFHSESRKKNSKYFDTELAEICNRVAENSCVLTSGSFLGAHFSRLLKQNMAQGLHEDNPLIVFTKTGDVELSASSPQDLLPERNLCSLKDVDPQMLPPHFRRMIERFKKSEKLSILPCVSNNMKGKNIVIVQNPCETKIILPPSTHR